MGKGNRNRETRAIENLEAPKTVSKKKKKQVRFPKWFAPAICVIVVVAIVAGIVFASLVNNGTFKRSRILVKSQSGKFDVDQQMATFMAWEYAYSYGAYWYNYASNYNANPDGSSLTDDQKSILNSYQSRYASYGSEVAQSQYALDFSMMSMENTPRSYVEIVSNMIPDMVAVCDAAEKDADFSLEESEWDDLLASSWLPLSYTSLQNMMSSSGYYKMDKLLDYLFDECMGIGGMREKDVKNAFRLVCTYQKYYDETYAGFKAAVTDEQIAEYIKGNPSMFYSTDYISFTTSDETLKENLLKAIDEKTFDTTIGEWMITENYRSWFNEFTAHDAAQEAILKLTVSGDDKETALKNAAEAVGAVTKEYKSGQTGVDEKILSYLFPSKNAPAAYAVKELALEDSYLVLAIKSVADEGKTVTVYEKEFAFSDGISYDGNDNFKDQVIKKVRIDLGYSEDTPDTVSYHTAEENANALLEEMKSMNETQINAKLTELHADNSTSEETDVAPDAVYELIEKTEKIEKGNLFVATDSLGAYIVYVTEVKAAENEHDDDVVEFSFAEVKADLYYEIADMMVRDVEASMPKVKSENYAKPEDETADTLVAWLFGGVEKNEFKSTVKSGDMKVITATANEKTTYTVYMVVGDPMHFNTELVADGGYLFKTYTDDEDGESERASDLKKFEGKTGADLTAVLTEMSSAATVSSEIELDSASINADVAAWMSDSSRKANDYTYLEDAHYFAVYLGSEEYWKVLATYGVANEAAADWLVELTGVVTDDEGNTDTTNAKYTVNTAVLDKIGKAIETETTTGEETTASAE